MARLEYLFCNWASSCSAKTRYSKRDHAEAQISRLRRSDERRDNESLNPYKCQFCNGFHFGHRCSSIQIEQEGENSHACYAD